MGTLSQDNCDPNCAQGQTLTYSVRIVASLPQKCNLIIHRDYSEAPSQVDALVYNEISVEALSGNPDPRLVGDGVFVQPCNQGD